MFISRLLTPTEIGVFSVTMVLVTFVMSLRDLGAGQYLIQEKDLTHERIRAAWTVSVGTGFLAGLIICIAAWPAAAFYGEPRMVDIMLIVAVNALINPFGSITYAWLMREMRFDALAKMRFAANLGGTGATVYLAWTGWGPVSLAFGTLLSTIVNGLVAASFRPKGFPILPSLRGIKPVMTIGSKISANGLVGVVGVSISELSLGKLQSLADAAMYSRANGLASMFHRMALDGINAVAIPMFAREAREKSDLNASFARALSYTTVLGWSFFLGLALLAFPAVRLLYGFQWDTAADPTRLIAIAHMFGIASSMCINVLMAIGAAGLTLRTNTLTVLVQIVLITIGAAISLNATAVAFLISSIIAMTIWLRVTHRELKFDWLILSKLLLKSLLVACTTSLAPMIVISIYGWQPEDRVTPLAYSTMGSVVIFLISTKIYQHPIQNEISKIFKNLPVFHMKN